MKAPFECPRATVRCPMLEFTVGGEILGLEPRLRIECAGNERWSHGIPRSFVADGISWFGKAWQNPFFGQSDFILDDFFVFLRSVDDKGVTFCPFLKRFYLSATVLADVFAVKMAGLARRTVKSFMDDDGNRQRDENDPLEAPPEKMREQKRESEQENGEFGLV